MPRSETAQAALEAVWAHMVERVEADHDLVVIGQASSDAVTAERIAARASEFATLAQAAAALARSARDGA
jgi:hypothetical protein